ncbi:uncharacterized protein LOC135497812 [Lineus longissimus]|uniref:uncharacterized protein LOC135497812 n=1 Tax=Lineus longissimus TaxID=88925 RepID=UPI002B4F60F9
MKAILAVLLFVGATQALVCDKDVCQRVRCMSVEQDSCDGRVDPKGGFCGCCPACIKQLDLKEGCLASKILGVPANIECGSGLYCHPEKNTCEYDCKIRRQAVLDRLENTDILGLEPMKCEEDGSYSAIQCKGSVCLCVDDRGNGLHRGVGRWETDGMNCNCERDKDAHAKKYGGALGKILRCKANGNYEDIQCEGSVCFCVDDFGKQIGSEGVNIGKMDSLNC